MTYRDDYYPPPRRRASPLDAMANVAIIVLIVIVGILAWPVLRDQLAPRTVPVQPARSADPAPPRTVPAPAAAPAAQPAAQPAAPANAEAQSRAIYDATVATAAASSGPAPCTLITWIDGSQGCNDGRAISAAQSKAGYCVPVVWDDGTISCNDGKPSGLVVWPEASAPQPTPWAAAPSDGVQWTSEAGPNGNTCVTVGAQTACSAAGVTLDSDDAAFVARMIEDGKIEKGKGAPHG